MRYSSSWVKRAAQRAPPRHEVKHPPSRRGLFECGGLVLLCYLLLLLSNDTFDVGRYSLALSESLRRFILGKRLVVRQRKIDLTYGRRSDE